MSKWYCVTTTHSNGNTSESYKHYYPDAQQAKRAREAMIRMNGCKKSIKSQNWNNMLIKTKQNVIVYSCYDFKTNGTKNISITVGNISVGPVIETETGFCK